jgi:carbon storage regulator CsrA
MLVLTRKYQEKIRIGNNITITVLRTKGKAVRLGIEAPTDVPVIRGELSFHGEAEHEAPETAASPALDCEVAGSDTTTSGRTFGRIADTNAVWPTSLHPTGSGVTDARGSAAKVGFTRVPRDHVAMLLPRMAAGTAPLRAMMDQQARG